MQNLYLFGNLLSGPIPEGWELPASLQVCRSIPHLLSRHVSTILLEQEERIAYVQCVCAALLPRMLVEFV